MTSSFEQTEYREGFAGGCYKNGVPACVIRDEPFCDQGTWTTAHFLRANGGHALRYCAGDIAEVNIGRCSGQEEDFCTNAAEACSDPSAYVPHDETCTIALDLKDNTPVLYGRCGADRCVWSSNDCLPGETFVARDPGCTSDKVAIGACFAGHAFCAVSAESCNAPGQPFEPFLTHQQVTDQKGVNCYLAQLPQPSAPTSPPPPNNSPDAAATTTMTPSISPPMTSNNNFKSSTSSNTNGPDISTGALLVGLVVGASLLVGAVVGLVAYRMGVRSSSTLTNSKGTVKTKKPPVNDLRDASGVVVLDDEELSA